MTDKNQTTAFCENVKKQIIKHYTILLYIRTDQKKIYVEFKAHKHFMAENKPLPYWRATLSGHKVNK